jgi:hypothetical protein
MREDEEQIERAQRSRAETAKLRGGEEQPPAGDVPETPLPEKDDSEPWAKASSGDKDSVTTDD